MGDKLSRKYELTIFPKKEGLEVIIRNGCKTKKMDTNIGKAIIGTFLILLGLLGIFFALALFFLLETLDLSTRIIISVAAGFIPLLFLLF